MRWLAQSKGIRFIGPNSVGLANLGERTIRSISQVFDQPNLQSRPIAFVTQSGAAEQPHAKTIDLNPIMATGEGAMVVDQHLIRLQGQGQARHFGSAGAFARKSRP